MVEFACGVWTGFALAVAAFLIFMTVMVRVEDNDEWE